MPFDPKFALDVLIPLAVHAYTEADLPRNCESLDKNEYKILGTIEVDPAKCREVWSRLSEDARISKDPTAAARANDMLVTAMADSHIFGFVAVERSDTFVCIRGTHFLSEWLRDFDLPLVPYRFRANAGLVHMGFQAIYETIQRSIVRLVQGQPTTVTVVGHSLGAALATLCALDDAVAAAAGGRVPAHVFPIASPRVGDGDFAWTFDNLSKDCIRIVNKPDLVPHLPLPVGYQHVGTAAVINSCLTLDLPFAHGLCEGYTRGLNRTIAEPAEELVLA